MAAVFLSCGVPGGTSGSGEFIDIKDYVESQTPVDAESLRINNLGLYFSGTISGSSPGTRVYRLQLSDGSPEWYVHKHEGFLGGFMPTKRTNEVPSEFNIFFWTQENYGYVGINSGTPALIQQPYPANAGPANVMVVDNSSNANTWGLYNSGGGVVVKKRSALQSEGFLTVTTIPSSTPSFEVEADDDEPVLWVGIDHKLHKVSSVSSIETLDLGALATLSPMDKVKKIRVVENVVWVQIGNKIFRLLSMKDAKVFEELQGAGAAMGIGGSFAVDNQLLYTTDGIKKDTKLELETNLFAGSLNYAISTAFQSALNIEVSIEQLDGYIYSVATSGRVLKVKK